MGILIAYLLGILTASKPKNQPTENNNYSANPPHTQSPTDRPISIMCIPPTESDEERAKKKKKERRKTIKFWVEIISAITLLSYLGVTIFIWRTSAKELELSQRPWVSLEKFTIDSPLTFDENGAHVTIGYEVKNTGRSPAIRGFWQPDFFLQFGETPSPVKKRDAACKFAAYRSTKVTDPRVAETWFPGGGIPRQIKEAIIPSDIANALEIPKQMFPTAPPSEEFGYIYPDFVICVAYRAAFTDAQYHTGYILELRRTTPNMPYIPPMKKGEIPASELKLFIHPFHGIDTEPNY